MTTILNTPIPSVLGRLNTVRQKKRDLRRTGFDAQQWGELIKEEKRLEKEVWAYQENKRYKVVSFWAPYEIKTGTVFKTNTHERIYIAISHGVRANAFHAMCISSEPVFPRGSLEIIN